MKFILVIVACFVASVIVEGKAVSSGIKYRQPFKIGFENAIHNAFQTSSSSSLTEVKKNFVGVDAVEIRGGGKASVARPPAILKWAYSAAGLAVTAVSITCYS